MEGKLIWAGVVIAAVVIGGLVAVAVLEAVISVGASLMLIST